MNEEMHTLELTDKQLTYLSNLLVDVFKFEEHLITSVMHCGSKEEAVEQFLGIGDAILKARGQMAPQLFLPFPKLQR